jgi:hypothetical protein
LTVPTPTPIYSLPIYSLPLFTIEQARAVAGVLRGYINDVTPTTNDAEDYTPPAELAEVSAALCHLDAGIETAERVSAAEATALAWYSDPGYRLRNDAPGCVTYSAATRAGAWARYDAARAVERS